MKIFIDFDDVIFDAKAFKVDLIKVFLKNGITRQEFENSYYTFQKKSQERGEYYDPKNQVEVLRKRNHIDRDKLNKDLDKFLHNLEKYVFPDVIGFLEKFPREDSFLITYGHIKFQMKKIFESDVSDHFDNDKIIFTKENKIDKIMEVSKKFNFSPDEKIVLIDDRPEQIEKTEEMKKSVVTIRMCRPEGRYSDLICLNMDYEVRNLKEVDDIMKKERWLI